MKFYPFHLGDYAAHTGHLDPLEDIAYRRLIDMYYLGEQPLVGQPEQLARRIRMREYADVVGRVLVEFFEEEAGPVWRNTRCDIEIAKYRAMLEGGRKGAVARWGKPSGDAQGNGGGIGGASPPQTPPNANQEPRTNTNSSSLRSEEDARKRAKPAPRPEEVSGPVWESFLTLRRAKKAPVTEAAMAGIVREAKKAGVSLEQALEQCCARGWTGFKAEWLQPAATPTPQACAPTESFRERDQRAARERWDEIAGRRLRSAEVIDITPTTLPPLELEG